MSHTIHQITDITVIPGCYSVPIELSTRALSLFPDRNVTTRLADIGVSSPVFGFLPGRLVLSRSSNLPKPEIFTGLPCSKESLISSKKSSTKGLLRACQCLTRQTGFQQNRPLLMSFNLSFSLEQ